MTSANRLPQRVRSPLLGAALLIALASGAEVVLLHTRTYPRPQQGRDVAIGLVAALSLAGAVAGTVHARTSHLRRRSGITSAIAWCAVAWSALAVILTIVRLFLPPLHLIGVDAETAAMLVGWPGAGLLAAGATVFALMMADAQRDQVERTTTPWLSDGERHGLVLTLAGLALIAWTSYSVLWRDTHLPIPGTSEEARGSFASVQHEALIRPGDARTQLAYGASLARLQRYGESVPILERAVRLDSADAFGRVLLAWSLTELGRSADGVPHLEAATRLAPEYAFAHRALAWNLARVGRWSEAEAAYRDATRLSPHDASIAAEYAVVLLRRAKWKSAVAHALRAERLDPQRFEYRMLAGSILRTESRFDESREHLREMVRMNPMLVAAWAELGVTEYLRHDATAAVAAFGEAARLDSSYMDHREPLAAMWRSARAGRTDDRSMGFSVGPGYWMKQ